MLRKPIETFSKHCTYPSAVSNTVRSLVHIPIWAVSWPMHAPFMHPWPFIMFIWGYIAGILNIKCGTSTTWKGILGRLYSRPLLTTRLARLIEAKLLTSFVVLCFFPISIYQPYIIDNCGENFHYLDEGPTSFPDFLANYCWQLQSSIVTGNDSIEYSAGAVYVCYDDSEWIQIGRGKFISKIIVLNILISILPSAWTTWSPEY